MYGSKKSRKCEAQTGQRLLGNWEAEMKGSQYFWLGFVGGRVCMALHPGWVGIISKTSPEYSSLIPETESYLFFGIFPNLFPLYISISLTMYPKN